MSDDDRTTDADPATLDRLRRAAQAAAAPTPAVGSQEWLDDMPTPPAGTPRIDPTTPPSEPVATPTPPAPHQPAPHQPARADRPVRPAFALGDLPDPGPRRPVAASSDDSERWRPPPRSMQPVAETTTVDHAVKWRVATIALAVVAAGLVGWLLFGGSGSSDEVDPANVAVTTIPVGDDPDPVVIQQDEGGAGG